MRSQLYCDRVTAGESRPSAVMRRTHRQEPTGTRQPSQTLNIVTRHNPTHTETNEIQLLIHREVAIDIPLQLLGQRLQRYPTVTRRQRHRVGCPPYP